MSPPSPDDTAEPDDESESDVDQHESDADTGEPNVDSESDTTEPDSDSDVDDDPTSEESPQGSTPAPASSGESEVSAAEDDPAMAESGAPTAEGDLETIEGGETTAEGGETTVEADPTVVDSKWWYWVAAVPAYAAVGLLGGIVAFGLFILTIGIDVAGGMGLATGALVLVGTLVAVLYGLAGLVLFVMFPIGIYLDAQAIAEADVDWEPDPVLYGIVAVTTALFSALLVSLVVAIYYLYRRNQVLGVP
jgi:hypothetical protein